VRDSGLAVTGLEALRDFEGLAGQLHAYKLDVAKSMLEICGAIGARVLLVEASTSAHADASVDTIVRDPEEALLARGALGIRIAFKGAGMESHGEGFCRRRRHRACAPTARISGLRSMPSTPSRPAFRWTRSTASTPEQIFLVQLSDYMWQEIRTTEERAATARHFRVFPGEGAHSDALANLVTRLDALGLLRRLQLRRIQRRLPANAGPRSSRNGRGARPNWLGETVLRRALPVPNMERLRPSQR